MNEWEKVYECLAELEGEYSSLLREQEDYQPVSEILLLTQTAKLYALLAALEHYGCPRPGKPVEEGESAANLNGVSV